MWQQGVLGLIFIICGILQARAVVLYKELNRLTGVNDEVVFWVWRTLPPRLAKPLAFGADNERFRQQAVLCFRAAYSVLLLGGVLFVLSLP